MTDKTLKPNFADPTTIGLPETIDPHADIHPNHQPTAEKPEATRVVLSEEVPSLAGN